MEEHRESRAARQSAQQASCTNLHLGRATSSSPLPVAQWKWLAPPPAHPPPPSAAYLLLPPANSPATSGSPKATRGTPASQLAESHSPLSSSFPRARRRLRPCLPLASAAAETSPL